VAMRPMAAPPHPWLKPAVLVGGLFPLAFLALQLVRGTLGANPIERVLNQTGLLALILLVALLACTPLKVVSGWTWPMRPRKLLGLLGFTYASLHFLTYAVLDQGLAFDVILEPAHAAGAGGLRACRPCRWNTCPSCSTCRRGRGWPRSNPWDN
jgi:DMSO/TMAO reductase YedYZ heme-binding membrane subunit